MTIGLDLDNTIVRYDECLHRLAGELHGMPGTVAVEKNAVRQFFRENSRERDWTALQGVAYGTRMSDAAAFPGVLDFVRRAIGLGHDVYIVSHRTRHPVIGEPVNLHELAAQWLVKEGFVADGMIPSGRVFFEETREAKIARIGVTGCEIFLDDLPEVLESEGFPPRASRFLFAPRGAGAISPGVRVVESWVQFAREIL